MSQDRAPCDRCAVRSYCEQARAACTLYAAWVNQPDSKPYPAPIEKRPTKALYHSLFPEEKQCA